MEQHRLQLLQELDEKCYTYLSSGYTPSTLSNKRTHGNSYAEFCRKYGLHMFPADEWQFIRYTVHLAESDSIHSGGTVKNYVGGVRSLHKLGGYPYPPASNANIKLCMDGVNTLLAKPKRQAWAMDMNILELISKQVDYSSSYQVCAYTAILVGFYLFLRKSNLVPESHPKFDPIQQLTRGSVAVDWEAWMVLVHILWSKTIKNFEKDLWLPLIPARSSCICPIVHVKLLLESTEGGDLDPLFRFYNRQGVLKCLTYDQLRKQLRLWIMSIGLDPDKYTPHCLRRGGASHAFRVGLSSDYIKLMGDWASDAYIEYLRINLDQRVEAAAQFMYG